jgi:hypothetical protein
MEFETNFGWDLPAGVSLSDFDEEPRPRRTWRQRLWLAWYDLHWQLWRLRRRPAVEISSDPFLPDFPGE